MADFTKEEAYQIYDKARQKFKDGKQIEGVLPENFEGCEWFKAEDGSWTRENEGSRMAVYISRHNIPYVATRFKHDDRWFTSQRYFLNG